MTKLTVNGLQVDGNVDVAIPGYKLVPTGGDPLALSFTVDKTTVKLSEPFTLTWVSRNAESCVASGAWNGVKPLTGSNRVTPGREGLFLYTLTCENAAGESISKSVAVEVEGKVIEPPGTIIRDWEDVFGVAYPNAIPIDKTFQVPRDGTLAIRFTMPDDEWISGVRLLETTTTTARRQGAISDQPDDFEVPGACDHFWGSGRGFSWSNDPTMPPTVCSLEKGKTYYLNFQFPEGHSSSQSVMRAQITGRKL